MRYLLDTHVALWLLVAPEKVSEEVRASLADPEREVSVSAVSAFECATKERLGKLHIPGLLESWESGFGDRGISTLPLDLDSARLAGRMSWDHRDPFDRLLVASALTSGRTFVTVDRAVVGFGGVPVLTW